MPKQFLQRRGTSIQWAAANPILAEGEIGIDKTSKTFKIGDGVSRWNTLKSSYILASQFQAKGDLLVGTGPNTATRLPVGTDGQTLSVDAAGNLVWINQPNLTQYVESGTAETLYETQAEAAAAHSQYVTTTDMGSTYQTLAASAATHAQFETFTHAAATYAPRSTNDAAYSGKGMFGQKTSTQTVNNSALTVLCPELTFATLANSVYIFDMFVSYVTTATAKMFMRIVSSAPGSTLNWGLHAPVSAMVAGDQFGASHVDMKSNGTYTLGGSGDTVPLFATIKGVLHSGTADGFCSLYFSQAVATNDTGAKILVPSYYQAYKVS